MKPRGLVNGCCKRCGYLTAKGRAHADDRREIQEQDDREKLFYLDELCQCPDCAPADR